MQNAKKLFTHHKLDEKHLLWEGVLPKKLHFDEKKFAMLWQMHPQKYHQIKMHGKVLETPRWQQAYGKNYKYTGSENTALPIPEILKDIVLWAQQTVDKRMNSILTNWYDGSLGHYMGKHRDSTHNMIYGTPIITISFGEERIFRMRPWKKKSYIDFVTCNNGIFILPYNTNEHWTHEVTKGKKYQGKRVSVTLRAFHSTAESAENV
ncbi:alpha-ketoglutarate-dependent dioxygenase AlkB [Candidatus Uabimicrobium sp. HlEnr_7]|uniref:alpha-ketoglutarate-dependent dioxygenase AlkB n=1 Tax=Candidatus Uabimicrobium helgolandensis TaxID=3095367 RepID=UPI0035593091